MQVDDVAAAFGEIERLGGRRLTDPMEVPNGPTFALFADPEGHTVGIAKPPSD